MKISSDILMGDYRFKYHFSVADQTPWFSCNGLLSGVCVYRVKRTWRACTCHLPSERFAVKDDFGCEVRFRTPQGAAKYLVEAITERKIKRHAA